MSLKEYTLRYDKVLARNGLCFSCLGNTVYHHEQVSTYISTEEALDWLEREWPVGKSRVGLLYVGCDRHRVFADKLSIQLKGRIWPVLAPSALLYKPASILNYCLVLERVMRRGFDAEIRKIKLDNGLSGFWLYLLEPQPVADRLDALTRFLLPEGCFANPEMNLADQQVGGGCSEAQLSAWQAGRILCQAAGYMRTSELAQAMRAIPSALQLLTNERAKGRAALLPKLLQAEFSLRSLFPVLSRAAAA